MELWYKTLTPWKYRKPNVVGSIPSWSILRPISSEVERRSYVLLSLNARDVGGIILCTLLLCPDFFSFSCASKVVVRRVRVIRGWHAPLRYRRGNEGQFLQRGLELSGVVQMQWGRVEREAANQCPAFFQFRVWTPISIERSQFLTFLTTCTSPHQMFKLVYQTFLGTGWAKHPCLEAVVDRQLSPFVLPFASLLLLLPRLPLHFFGFLFSFCAVGWWYRETSFWDIDQFQPVVFSAYLVIGHNFVPVIQEDYFQNIQFPHPRKLMLPHELHQNVTLYHNLLAYTTTNTTTRFSTPAPHLFPPQKISPSPIA